MAAATAGLLHALGVSPADERDALEDTCVSLLQGRGHVAEVVGLTYGTLTLKSSPVAAGLLRWDLDELQATLEDRFPGKVARIVIRTS